MPRKRTWLRRRRDDQAPPPAPVVHEPPAAPTPPSPPTPPAPPFPPDDPQPAPWPGYQPEAAGDPVDDDEEAPRSPLVQARYDRLAAAAGIDPDRGLSPHARSVLDWLARQDDATCSGVIELLQATSIAAAQAARGTSSPP
jgi:hypothetical protein